MSSERSTADASIGANDDGGHRVDNDDDDGTLATSGKRTNELRGCVAASDKRRKT